MRREGRMPVAARRRPESSGLHNPFPHSGNDNRHDNLTRYLAKFFNSSLPRPALLDSSFRWNDAGIGMGLSSSR